MGAQQGGTAVAAAGGGSAMLAALMPASAQSKQGLLLCVHPLTLYFQRQASGLLF